MNMLLHKKCRTVVAFGAMALVVGGCSGSSSAARDEFAVRPIPSFAATDAVSKSLFERGAAMSPTLAAQLPTTGTATYTGAVAYVDSNTSFVPVDEGFSGYERYLVNNADYVSRIQMTANLAGDSVAGSMDGFRDSSNGGYRIGITFNGQIVESKDKTAAFSGTLQGTNEVRKGEGFETLNFGGTIKGNFLGSRGDTVQGSLAIKRGFDGKQDGDVFGAFTAEQ